jgi:hypothetical protein
MSLKKAIVAGVWALALAIWLGIAAFYFTDPELKAWAIAVAVGAVALEIAFWTTAAMLGITLLQSRKAVLRFITRPFRREA